MMREPSVDNQGARRRVRAVVPAPPGSQSGAPRCRYSPTNLWSPCLSGSVRAEAPVGFPTSIADRAPGCEAGDLDNSDRDTPLSRTAASEAVEAIGWRYLLGTLCAAVRVESLAQASRLAAAATATAGAGADGHLRLDLRPDRVELSVQDRRLGAVTRRDTELAGSISETVRSLGLSMAPARSIEPNEPMRPVQMLELAIDAMDIARIRPFWKAVMAYVDQPGDTGPEPALVDPAGQLPAIWFQQMDAPRPQRNRVHFDVTVANDEAELRVRAALDAGGVLVTDRFARSFWVLADAEGNEVCVCSWMDRDNKE